MKAAANIQGMLHAFASDEVMKHALASYAFEQFEAACYQTLVTAAEQAGGRPRPEKDGPIVPTGLVL